MELSGSLRAADRAALLAQRSTRRIYATELAAVVVAALAGSTAWRLGQGHLDLLAVLATAGFAAALAAGLYRGARQPQADWVRARAAAEAIRAAAWRYAVGGTPFDLSEATADVTLLAHIDAAREALDDRDLVTTSATTEITEEMRATRDSDLEQRKNAYRGGRLEDQISYYARRCAKSDRARKSWFWLGMAANTSGVLGGVLRIVSLVNVDLVGIAAAVAGAAGAWTQLNQHRTLSIVYSQTLWQLKEARAQLGAVDEDEWPGYVDSVEDVMAREHSLWLRRRISSSPGSIE